MTSGLGFAHRRIERLAVAGLFAVVVVVGAVLPGGVPAPVFALGAVGGASIALHALGIVLVYRSSRVINFAQIQMGVSAGAVFAALVGHRTFIRAVAAVCAPCLSEPTTLGELVARGGNEHLSALLADPVFSASFPMRTPLSDPTLLSYFPPGYTVREFAISAAPGWLVHLNYWLSMITGIALATLLLWAVYALVIRRFTHAPKLVLTVITIAAGSFVRQASSPILGLLFPSPGEAVRSGVGSARLPGPTFTWSPVVFSAAEIVTVAVAVVAAGGLAVFLARSRLGVVLRGAAENPDRAETLGVNVRAVTARAWVIAGVLSGTAAVLAVARTGAPPSDGGIDVFVRTLAAAVAGGLVFLPIAVAAGLVIGVADQVFAWIFGTQAPIAALLLGIIILLLLVQRARAGRAEREANASWQASRELRPIPQQLRRLPPVRAGVRTMRVIGSLVLLGFPWFMSPSQTNTGINIMVLAMMGMSLLVLTGWAGQISLGQMAIAGVGAWVAAASGLPFALALLAGATAGTVVSVAVGFPSMKLRGLHLAVTTLALGFAVSATLFDPDTLGRYLPRRLDRPMMLGIDFASERSFYYLTLGILIATVVAVMGLRRSIVARTLIAAKDNEDAAMGFGIDLLRARVAAFAIAGAIAAVAGCVLAYAQNGIEPLAFAPETSISVFLMTLLGGMGSIGGPLVGALYLGTLRIASTSAFRQFADILLDPGLGVILLLLVLPGGVIQGLYAGRDAWLRRIASRHRISVPSLQADRRAGGGKEAIQPKLRPTGGTQFIPRRFRLDDQWAVAARRAGDGGSRDA